jgi:D-aminoacyl-tRNA deacylase
VLLVGVEDTDGAKQIDWLARKIANLRVFEDENGKMNRSIHDVNGSVLSISQFTLYANVRKGNRPSFVKAGAPAHAEQTWHGFNDALRAQGFEVKEGRFGSHMLPRWVESPTNSCGMSFAARMNCARSDSVNGRQLTINLRSFHIPMRFTL